MTWLRRIRFPLLLMAGATLAPLLGRAGFLSESKWLYLGVAVTYAAAALSLNLLMGYAGQISLGHFALLGTGALVSGVVTSADRGGLPFMVALPVCAIVGGVVAFVLGLPALRLRGLYLAVITIGFAYVADQTIFKLNYLSHGSAGIHLPRPLVNTFSFSRTSDFMGILCVLLVVIWQVDRNVTRTKLGRAFHGIRIDESVAASFGVDPRRYKLLAFVISGAMAGVAGSMYGHVYMFVNNESFGFEKSLLLVIIVVVGGLGSRAGVIVSAFFYALFGVVLTHISWLHIFRGFDILIGAALLMYTVSRHPGGLAQAFQESRDRERRGTPDEEAEEPALPKLPEMPRPSGLPERPTVEGLSGSVPVLAAHEISVRFGGLQAVNAASLAVPRNKIVGLIGPNGAGKTTMFNAMSGLLKPNAGKVELLGQDVSEMPAHARARLGMGRTFQLIGLAGDLSVTENLLLAQHVVASYGVLSALTQIGPSRSVERELRDRAAEAISALGFERFANTPVKRLSHGQQRIVELGCVLVTAPEVVMLDEPSAGMSPGAAENLAVRLRDMRDDLGRTILLIEHNIPLVLDVCDELYVLSGGEILAHGLPDEVVQRPDVIAAYLGEPAAAAIVEAEAEAEATPVKAKPAPRKRTRAGAAK
ncbi:MAG: branched-chain amino acid transport system ATP-binding protein livM [Actinomycetota bacterium]|jgi:ABC-type branched-subunit amino acid transport system ATPase component/ABC-type branched-subunit amino acid transport system permease subunit|nr:branched-chain amino acid transport system ATP-binding protein livM [Actinomycetota bacterium]